MPCSVILPAGYGKTELLAEVSIRVAAERQVLILTHTNAGVAALRTRLHRKNAIGPISVTTISALAERLVHSYPAICGYVVAPDVKEDYQVKHLCASRFFRSEIGQRVAASSWGHVLVDEYQDCSRSQHDMIFSLSEVVPVMVVGDPLQAIFDFQSEALVDWDSLISDFPLTVVTAEPRRWLNSNPGLGHELERLRSQIIAGSPIDLRSYKHITHETYHRKFVARLSETVHRLPGQSVIIHPGRSQYQSIKLASGMKNRFTVVEQRAMPALRALSLGLDVSDGNQTVGLVLKAAGEGLANLGAAKAKLAKIAAGERPKTQQTTSTFAVASAGIRCADNPEPGAIAALVEELLLLDGLTVSRRQFWSDFLEMLRMAKRSAVSYEEAFEALRSKRQRSVLRPTDDIVARPLMVKGLEFPNVLVLEGDRFGTRELYVAATRASSSLVIASASPILRPSDVDSSRRRVSGPATEQGQLL